MNKVCSIGHKDTGVFLENEKKIKLVAFFTLLTMILEIMAGYWSNSMALLADGWHMASHAIALFLTLLVYYLFRHQKFRSSFTFGGGKILSLGGYTSALFLVFIAFSMIQESYLRFRNIQKIHFDEALLVSVIGLVINLLSVFILQKKESHSPDKQCVHRDDHHHHHDHNHQHHHHHHHHHNHHHDHNHASAYVHILTDAMTSVLAILALLLGKYWDWSWADSLVGILGGFVVLKWAFGLIKDTAKDLLDAHDLSIDKEALVKCLEKDGSQVIDLHLWKLSPHQIGCELIIKSFGDQKSSDYKDLIQKDFNIHHLIVEVI